VVVELMRIVRIFDERFIHDCIAHKSVWPHITDDGSPDDPAFYFPPMVDAVHWLEVRDDEKRLGVFMVHPLNSICGEAHVALLPAAWGRSAEAARLAVQWVFENTAYQRLIVNVPSGNKLAARLATKSGMDYIGNNKNSFMKNGVVQAQLMFGISKEAA